MGLRFPLCSHQLLRPDLELARRLAVWLQHFGAGQALGTSSSDTFSHPACRFLSPLTNRRRNWRNNAQVHVLAISLLPWTLTNTAMGKKKHNCNRMLHVSPSIFKACIWGKIVFLDSIVQKHCPSISSTLSLSYKYYFHKMQSELMLFFYMSFLCHKIAIPAEIEFILQHPYSKKSLKDYQKLKLEEAILPSWSFGLWDFGSEHLVFFLPHVWGHFIILLFPVPSNYHLFYLQAAACGNKF